jgi:cell wall integrity and stress response component
MKALHSIVLIALTCWANIAIAAADAKYYACYSSAGSLAKKATNEFNSRGDCRKTCVDDNEASGGLGFSVMGMTKGTQCYCGNKLPNEAVKVDDTKCKQECPGFGSETCGSRLGDYWSVYTTGLEDEPEMDPAPSSSSSSSASKTSTSSDDASTAAVTTSSAAEQQSTVPTAESKSVNKAGIAAGAVIGVLAIIGLGVGVFIFLRKRRRQEVEEEYRRSAAVRGFVQKPALDTRLDPVMAQKRDSVGSIADNQDYSRKILRVTNPE